jgi:hypothetical protein
METGRLHLIYANRRHLLIQQWSRSDRKNYGDLLKEIKIAITSVKEESHKNFESEEPTKRERLLYSPTELNKAFKAEFSKAGGWARMRVPSEYSVSARFYEKDYKPTTMNRNGYREMDFVKGELGVEVQFGKYSFMVYNVCAKMTIFKNLKRIRAGVEIVPMKSFAQEMSSGISYFEQFVWDLEIRGVSNIDIPVLILGVTADWDKIPEQTLPEQITAVSTTVVPIPQQLTPLPKRRGAKPGPKPSEGS